MKINLNVGKKFICRCAAHKRYNKIIKRIKNYGLKIYKNATKIKMNTELNNLLKYRKKIPKIIPLEYTYNNSIININYAK